VGKEARQFRGPGSGSGSRARSGRGRYGRSSELGVAGKHGRRDGGGTHLPHLPVAATRLAYMRMGVEGGMSGRCGKQCGRRSRHERRRGKWSGSGPHVKQGQACGRALQHA
jgi:hypothetical protein